MRLPVVIVADWTVLLLGLALVLIALYLYLQAVTAVSMAATTLQQAQHACVVYW